MKSIAYLKVCQPDAMKLARKIIRIMIGCLFLISGIFGFVLHLSSPHQPWWLFVTQSSLIILGLWCLFFVKD